MTFDKRTTALISVGASVAANCHPCLENHTCKALEAGLTNEEIQAAIEVGKAVRAGAANSMDRLALALVGQSLKTQSCCSTDCGC